jgi:hypothetical protein
MPPIIAGGNRRDKHRTTSAGSAHWASPQDACRSSLPDFARPLIEVNSFENYRGQLFRKEGGLAWSPAAGQRLIVPRECCGRGS